MTSPVGEDAYKGLAVPLFGDSLLQQINSSNAILTFVHSTVGPNEGRFLLGKDGGSTVLRDYFSSIISPDLAVWDIDGDGGYRAVSGTTIIMELNSSFVGNVEGTTLLQWRFNTSGQFTGVKQTVTRIATGADFTIESSQSGTLFTLTSASGTSMKAILPADAPTGTWYEFWISSDQAETSEFAITSTGGGGVIQIGGLTSLASTEEAITPAAFASPYSLRLTLVATDLWAASRMGGLNYSTADTTDYTQADIDRNAWLAGSTVP